MYIINIVFFGRIHIWSVPLQLPKHQQNTLDMDISKENYIIISVYERFNQLM